ncbi:MAG: 2-hydroxyacid dehydrogenase [Lachnospiraceae bacterium]|nr:2-hydroxyacid dehydrogenase [Lachnospiraceae bacterium]
MKRICFFDTKPYDRLYFDEFAEKYGFEMVYCESKLNEKSVVLARGCDAAVAFVNDSVNAAVLRALEEMGISIVAMRCAGYNNVDFKEAYGKVHIVRVPAYSPYAVAEFTMGMFLTLNRKFHRAYNRVREYNFSLSGLLGTDLYGKTIGVVGTGKIGQVFIDICLGFGMRVLAYDPYPKERKGVCYVGFEELCKNSDMISLHCPLTKESYHIVNKEAIQNMRDGVVIVNTSRGALIDTSALIESLKDGKVGAAGLDVYEEEGDFFYEDYSGEVMPDDELARLISMPNVLLTSHQAFLTEEALKNIAETTTDNLYRYFAGEALPNEVCYRCSKDNTCKKEHKERCF